MELEIIQVVQELSTNGGAERVAWELARAFNRAGVKNKAIASNVGEPIGGNTFIKRTAAWLAWIPTRGPLKHVGRGIVVPFFTIAATLELRRHPHAMVLSHGDSLRGDALVVHSVNRENLAQKRKAGYWTWLLNPLHLWVWLRDRWMIRGLRYRMFVAVSARVSKDLQRHYAVPSERIRVIPNGIDVERFRPDPASRRAVREEFGIAADAKLLVFVGHEFRRKGLAHAIGALQLLGPDFRLLVVGADRVQPYRKLAPGAGDRLIFAGSRHDMPAIYAAADALILPTSYETFSLACMEAMACSVPVFATRVGGIEDYLQDGVNGYGIAMEAEDIAGKIEQAFSDEALLNRLRIGARATALDYGWDRIASKYIDLMAQLQASRPAVLPIDCGIRKLRAS